MTEKLEIYRCKICGNTVQVLLDGVGELVCCEKPMMKLTSNTQEHVTTEYHIPVYIKDDNGFTSIQVGKDPHPMTEEHHIEFIERVSDDKRKVTLEYLQVHGMPRIELQQNVQAESAIEFCNLHGLWEGKNNA